MSSQGEDFFMMFSLVGLIHLFKNIGDAWIKGMLARNFQMGKWLSELKLHPFGVCIAPRCGS